MSQSPIRMRSSRPYLLRAIYEWIVDHDLTPYLMVNAMFPQVSVPERFIEDGKIVLNIEVNAVHQLVMGNEAVEFKARFSGAVHHIYLPIGAITAIYAMENGRGMVFGEEEEEDPPTNTASPINKGSKKPHLQIVK